MFFINRWIVNPQVLGNNDSQKRLNAVHRTLAKLANRARFAKYTFGTNLLLSGLSFFSFLQNNILLSWLRLPSHVMLLS
jgi:hypothetical protein